MSEKNTKSTAPKATSADGEHSVITAQAFTKDSAYFVTLPDGSVVSTLGEFLFREPGTYIVEGQSYVVPDPNAPIDQE